MKRDFAPTVDMTMLHRRSTLIKSIRSFFDSRGFLEVDTPLLSSDIVVDRHLDPIQVNISPTTGLLTDAHTMYLQTSPEFAMKRLLTAGSESIYQIAKAFRACEVGENHNPEFTILEWYQVNQSYADAREFLSMLVSELLDCPSAEEHTYQKLFHKATTIDPFSASDEQLMQFAKDSGKGTPDYHVKYRDAWLEWIFAEFVEPIIGKNKPTIVYDYPASQAALSKIRSDEHPVAERFEIFYCGFELANGYHELLDANELMERNNATNLQRVFDGKSALPSESRLLDAMGKGMPECCGCALGIDRLLMVQSDAKSIDAVIPFPFDRA